MMKQDEGMIYRSFAEDVVNLQSDDPLLEMRGHLGNRPYARQGTKTSAGVKSRDARIFKSPRIERDSTDIDEEHPTEVTQVDVSQTAHRRRTSYLGETSRHFTPNEESVKSDKP
uniref:Uncharacterized protein n=1 Tax=Timema genevievae TaxID=629358 RepID=A0A7R9JV83_TIMGE|nr:unnamed protein product [Timema genevievae]